MKARDQILARMYVMLTLFSIVPVLIVLKILNVTIVKGDELRAAGDQQATSYAEIPALRGAILDRTGKTLVANVERFDVDLDPRTTGFSEHSAEFFKTLSRISGKSVRSLKRRVSGRSSPRYVRLVRGLAISGEERKKLEAVSGVTVVRRVSRRYNYGKTAAHILGYVDADLNGIAGLEQRYNSVLRGVAGRRALRRDRTGRLKVVAGSAVRPPVHGENIVLTISLARQAIMEEELKRGVSEAVARWGTAIAMNPKTGEILGLANYPTFDPNTPASFDVQSRRNHAITDQIEPGSSFKLISAVAVIESGLISMSDTVDTGDGTLVQFGRTLRDTRPHGRIPFKEVISLSSNVGVAKVVENLDPATLFQFARNAGVGIRTGIDLPGEVTGRLKKPSLWSGSTKSAMSRGYEVEVSPLQILTAYSALANGGLLVRPYLVSERRNVTGRTVWTADRDSVRRAFHSATARTLLPAFEEVVNSGTATQARIEGVRIAGKTGTARIAKNGAYTSEYRATFVGFFPVEDPQVAIIVLMDRPRKSIYGGSVSAPVFRRISKRWLATMPAVRQKVRNFADTPSDSMMRAPSVVGLPLAVARRRLRSLGLEGASSSGEPTDMVLSEQSESDDIRVLSGAVVELKAGADRHRDMMPDLRGIGVRDASFILASRGIRARFEGSGKVVRQWPEPGEKPTGGAVLQCE